MKEKNPVKTQEWYERFIFSLKPKTNKGDFACPFSVHTDSYVSPNSDESSQTRTYVPLQVDGEGRDSGPPDPNTPTVIKGPRDLRDRVVGPRNRGREEGDRPVRPPATTREGRVRDDSRPSILASEDSGESQDVKMANS